MSLKSKVLFVLFFLAYGIPQCSGKDSLVSTGLWCRPLGLYPAQGNLSPKPHAQEQEWVQRPCPVSLNLEMCVLGLGILHLVKYQGSVLCWSCVAKLWSNVCPALLLFQSAVRGQCKVFSGQVPGRAKGSGLQYDRAGPWELLLVTG